MKTLVVICQDYVLIVPISAREKSINGTGGALAVDHKWQWESRERRWQLFYRENSDWMPTGTVSEIFKEDYPHIQEALANRRTYYCVKPYGMSSGAVLGTIKTHNSRN